MKNIDYSANRYYSQKEKDDLFEKASKTTILAKNQKTGECITGRIAGRLLDYPAFYNDEKRISFEITWSLLDRILLTGNSIIF